MALIKLYNNTPKNNEYVNFMFTEHHDNYIQCYLIDYGIDAIMTFKCLTKKKKIKSLKSLAPLNKPTIGLIESIDNDNIELNVINVNKDENNYIEFIENNSKNHILKKLINQYSHKYKIKIDDILQNYLYNQDNNYYYDNILESNDNNEFYNFFRDNQQIDNDKLNKIYFQIYCYGDINDVKILFNNAIDSINLNNIKIIQPKVSYYMVSSLSKLDDFIKFVKENINNYENLELANISNELI
jgi:hypothetical protein